MTTEKQCFRCQRVLPIDQFYRHPRMADGNLNKCKECNKIDVRLNRRDKAEYYSEFDKKRNGSEKRKIDRKIRLVKYREEHPDKNRAHQLVAAALKSGKLIRPKKCEDCGKLDLGEKLSDLHAHHHDYTKPLDVKFVCAKCHGKEHHELIIPDFYPK